MKSKPLPIAVPRPDPARQKAPLHAGLASTVGLLASRARFEFVRSDVSRLGSTDWGRIHVLYAEMEAAAVRELAMAGVTSDAATFLYGADLRYLGQGHEVHVALQLEAVEHSDVAAIRSAFHVQYARMYGASFGDAEVEAVSWRLFASGPDHSGELALSLDAAERGGATGRAAGERPTYVAGLQRFVPTAVYDRTTLATGMTLVGPAIIEERESTTVIGAAARMKVDAAGNLVVTLPAVDSGRSYRSRPEGATMSGAAKGR